MMAAAADKKTVVVLYTDNKHAPGSKWFNALMKGEPRVGSMCIGSGDNGDFPQPAVRRWDEKTGNWRVVHTTSLGGDALPRRRVHVFTKVPPTTRERCQDLEAGVGRVVYSYSVQHGKQVCTVRDVDGVTAYADVVGPRPRSTKVMEDQVRLFGESLGLPPEHACVKARKWARCTGESSYRSYDKKAYRDAVKQGVPEAIALREANTGDRPEARLRALRLLQQVRKKMDQQD